MAAKKKRSFADYFYRLLEKAVRDIDQKAIEADVKAMRKTHPGVSQRELAMTMTRRAASKTAAIGAAASTVGSGPMALVAFAPDIFNLVRQQSRLVLSIAEIYGHRPSVRERVREVLITLGTASGASFVKKGAQYLVLNKMKDTTARGLVRHIAPRMIGRKLGAVLGPVIGFAIGGITNYLSVRAVGIAAQKYYSALSRRKAEAKKPTTRGKTPKRPASRSSTRTKRSR